MKINPRVIAAKMLLQVIEDHHSLTAIFATTDLQHTQASLVKELCFGVCRWYFRLVALAQLLLAKPLKAKDNDIYILILLGLYQILYLRMPEHAAVLETVEAVKALKKAWAAGLVNGILRNFLRQREKLVTMVDHTVVGRYAHPQWMANTILTAWPEQGEAILAANNQHPPFWLRVNLLKTTQEEYLKSLLDKGIEAVVASKQGVIVAQAQDVAKLPGFSLGQFFVQDGAAQWAAALLMLEPGQRVLDACAAPGGKTTHILETEPELKEVVALDKDPKRVMRIEENIRRLGFVGKVQYRVADATQTALWWDGQLFDRILVDAPCSGTGVIRRHPDIKLLRQPEDIAALAQQQRMLLEALWPLLKPGGVLLYVTCSILPDENEKLIMAFLEKHPEAASVKIAADCGISTEMGWQILPGDEAMDGFYYARMKKTH